MSQIHLSTLIEAGVHFGHKANRWNPKMLPYIYKETNNIHIIDLVQTSVLLKQAQKYVKSSMIENKKFLFVGTKRQAKTLIAQEAKRCNAFYVNHRWLGGMLTNWVTVKERIKRLKELEKQESENTFSLLTKKEVTLRKKELQKLRKHLGGIKEMQNLPDVAIIIDQKKEMTAIQECQKLNIPIISIIDTNCDPDFIDIPIPGNDDSVKSLQFIIQSLTNILVEKNQLI